MTTARNQRLALIAFFAMAIALYAYGVMSARYIPSHIEGIALPLDFMVGIPLFFYLMVIRPRGLTLLAVIPTIWLGCVLSSLALGADTGILPYLISALVPVELAIAVKECVKLIKAFKSAKAKSSDPMAWLKATMLYLVPKDALASMTAAELSVWYYALFSWRCKPYILPGEKPFSYHNAGGYMNVLLGLAIAFPVEIIGVHLLISQWNVVAACVVTGLSIYAAIWLIGDARARIMRPIAVGEGYIRLECGIQMQAKISLSEIEALCHSEQEFADLPECEKLNYGTFYQANTWIVTKRPLSVRTMLGAKQVRAIGVSVDDPQALAREIQGER